MHPASISASKEELVSLVKTLKIYRQIQKISQKKATRILRKKLFQEVECRIEYCNTLEPGVRDELYPMYTALFWKYVEKKDIVWVQRSDLDGGARFFWNDDFFDITLQRVGNQILKS